MSLQDYEKAAEELRQLCQGVTIESRPLDRDGVMLRFHCTLKRDGVTIETTYGAGVGIAWAWGLKHKTRPSCLPLPSTIGGGEWRRALHYHTGPTLHVDAIRRAIERAYRPEAFDVLSALLGDQASAADYSDWIDWAEEYSMLDGKADSARKAREGFATIKRQTPLLHRMFGKDYERALELSREL